MMNGQLPLCCTSFATAWYTAPIAIASQNLFAMAAEVPYNHCSYMGCVNLP
jgi:hypothetical protein